MFVRRRTERTVYLPRNLAKDCNEMSLGSTAVKKFNKIAYFNMTHLQQKIEVLHRLRHIC